MKLPKLQPIIKEFCVAIYHNAPAWAKVDSLMKYEWREELPYIISRYRPGTTLVHPQELNYDLPVCRIPNDIWGNYAYTGYPLTVLEVTEDRVEQGFMSAQHINGRTFYISEYVLKQYDYYFTQRKKNRDTCSYNNREYLGYLRKYFDKEDRLLRYFDTSSYQYTVVTRDVPELGWAKPVVLPIK
jgi:hypothetical protein